VVKKPKKAGFFGCKKCIFWCFLMKNEAKNVFFEVFLGVKTAKKGLLSADNMPESV
jgi:hypothetical protein